MLYSHTSAFNGDESGASMLLEYIFTIIISVVVFAMLLMNLGSIMSHSDQIVMGEELDIAASIIANQLGDYSNELYLNDITLHTINNDSVYSMAATEDSYRCFDIPKPYSNRQYSVEVQDLTGHGRVTVTYVSDASVYAVTYFNSSVPITYNKFVCNSYNIKIRYDPGGKMMVLEEV